MVAPAAKETAAMPALPDPARQPLFALAETLPGAAGLLRRAGFDLRAEPDALLAEAAPRRGLDGAALAREITALGAPEAAQVDTPGLIAHIVARYHEGHRRDLARLIPLAAEVETRHAAHPAAPLRVGALLEAMREAMDEHMFKEEERGFPMMLQGGGMLLGQMLDDLEADHDDHGAHLRALEWVMRGHRAPEDASDAWHDLCAGTEAFFDDLVTHMYLEDEVLFPRFRQS
jgi:regulator of cell morphogenesis and NO signaling